ncbi:MAG: hypothetical protein JXJ20_03915 [Anaerolineae bacterium]|jgi:hypothetical protein|nr:hypothetical protein [Anaerolineae bacterium]
MMNGAQHDGEHEEIEYVGAPTEYAEAEEVPEWITTLSKIVFVLPTALAALSVVQLVSLLTLLACIGLFVLCVLAM